MFVQFSSNALIATVKLNCEVFNFPPDTIPTKATDKILKSFDCCCCCLLFLNLENHLSNSHRVFLAVSFHAGFCRGGDVADSLERWI